MTNTQDTIPKRFRGISEKYPETAALLSKNGDPTFQPVTYSQLYDIVRQFAAVLVTLGVGRGDHVGIISDNRKEWIITDLALLSIGAIDVPRGSDSMANEIGFILGHADCPITFVENENQLEKILSQMDRLPLLKRAIVYDEAFIPDPKRKYPVEILKFSELLERGKTLPRKKIQEIDAAIDKGTADDWATIIYTSGTTGEPKGVILTHRGFLFHVDRILDRIPLKSGHVFISVLPIWHSFERAVEYIIILHGATIAYSKPIGSIMLPDMLQVRPHWMASVPRIWESVRSSIYRTINKDGGIKKALFYFFVAIGKMHSGCLNMVRGLLPEFSKRSRVFDIAVSVIPLILLTPFKLLGGVLVFRKIKKKLGGRFMAGISGGGALPPYVDTFFQAAGITLIEGYGLTETAPILAVRKYSAPVGGTVGSLLDDIEYRIVEKDMSIVPPGHKGILHVKSEQVMIGYYKRPDATEAVLKDGWLDTGDITMETHNGEIKIIGREKDTIVLTGGENIEPEPIESKLVQSDYIDQAMVVGQDKKFLAALIVPNQEKLVELAAQKQVTWVDTEELLVNPAIIEFINEEIQALINPKTGFKYFERIFRFRLLSKHFEIGDEMTASQKVKRPVVNEKYRKEIHTLFL